jgi:small subunit ribosomal protein S30e
MAKIHGSLARAGKVRKQTLKVEKKDRIRKIVNGRAKKRLQFKKKNTILTTSNKALKKNYHPNRNIVK